MLLPAGGLGEVVIRGPTVTKGYEGNPEANAGAFANGWFKTGDLGYIDSEGYIFLTDRIKEVINRGGEKISPREVDEALLSHPSIRQAVTFPMPDNRLGEEVAAAVVVRENSEVTEWEIQRHVSARLSSFKVPRRLFFVDEIPRGPTGKIQRKTMAQRLMNESVTGDTSPHSEYYPPTNDLERALVEIWSRVLKTRKIGIRDDYFALGGDSLRAEEMVTLISARLGIRKIPIVIFIHAPTIEKMAIMLSSEVADLSSILVCMQPNGDKTPMYIVHACDGEVILFTSLVYRLGKQRPIYALRAPFLNGEKIPRRVVEEYSRRYLKEIQKKQARGPYILAGAGPGGLIALEMARQLRARARSVRRGHLMKSLASVVERLSALFAASRSHIAQMNNASRRYDPVQYLSPVLLFIAQTKRGFSPDPSVRIKELLLFLRGDVDVHVIQGEHMDVLKEPGARRIADIINKYIKE